MNQSTADNSPVATRSPRDSRKRVLDPVDRISEVIFGLIMALTFTCALSAADADRSEVRDMLVGSLGCNLAWGLVDAAMFLLASFVERSHNLTTLRRVRAATDIEVAHGIIRESLSPMVSAALPPEAIESAREHLVGPSLRLAPPQLRRDDWLGAAAVFIAVFTATFPVVIPFLLFGEAKTALRISNLVALCLLFIAGHALGRHAQYHPWRMGLIMALVGSVLVAITIALGG